MSQQQDFMNIIEAALLAAGRPLDNSELMALFEGEPDKPDRKNLREIITQLQEDWAERSLELIEVATGYRFQVKAEYARWMGRLWTERAPRYSRALLETLALIAYRQPVTRAEIEDVRGVAVSPTIIKTLQEREWIRVLGHRDVPGRPALFGTTKEFLDSFGLKTLEDLPPLAELKDIENLHADLFSGLEDANASAPAPQVETADPEPSEAGGIEGEEAVAGGASPDEAEAVAQDAEADEALADVAGEAGAPDAGQPEAQSEASEPQTPPGEVEHTANEAAQARASDPDAADSGAQASPDEPSAPDAAVPQAEADEASGMESTVGEALEPAPDAQASSAPDESTASAGDAGTDVEGESEDPPRSDSL